MEVLEVSSCREISPVSTAVLERVSVKIRLSMSILTECKKKQKLTATVPVYHSGEDLTKINE